jgi:hypothetical protein
VLVSQVLTNVGDEAEIMMISYRNTSKIQGDALVHKSFGPLASLLIPAVAGWDMRTSFPVRVTRCVDLKVRLLPNRPGVLPLGKGHWQAASLKGVTSEYRL